MNPVTLLSFALLLFALVSAEETGSAAVSTLDGLPQNDETIKIEPSTELSGTEQVRDKRGLLLKKLALAKVGLGVGAGLVAAKGLGVGAGLIAAKGLYLGGGSGHYGYGYGYGYPVHYHHHYPSYEHHYYPVYNHHVYHDTGYGYGHGGYEHGSYGHGSYGHGGYGHKYGGFGISGGISVGGGHGGW